MKPGKILLSSASAALLSFASALAQETSLPDAAPERDTAVTRVLGTVTVTATKQHQERARDKRP